MKKILSIRFKGLKTAESFELLKECLNLAMNDEKVSVRFASRVSLLQAVVNDFDDQLLKPRKTGFTDDVVASRDTMTDAYCSFRAIIDGMCIYAPTAALKASAKKVQLVLDTYNITPRMTQVERKGLIYNLGEDLSADDLASEVKALGMEMWVKGMIHERDVFSQTLDKRTYATPTKGTRHLSASRGAAEKEFRAFASIVNAIAALEGVTDYDPFIEKVNQKLSFYRQTLANRRKAKSGKEEQEPSEEKASEIAQPASAGTETGADPAPETVVEPENTEVQQQ